MDIEQAVNLAIDNVITEWLNDIYPTAFEVEMLKDQEFRNNIIKAILAKLKKNSIDEMIFSHLEYSYFPKKEAFDFRKAASIQPWDLIKYLSLVLMCADDIEAARPKIDENIVFFSYRFLPNAGFLFKGNNKK
ncbi:MAG: hypothetical protein LBK73_03100 [Treponema sp.]|jgi:hypothetical protein|nr:hypothetical protein [Treponema sp.]